MELLSKEKPFASVFQQGILYEQRLSGCLMHRYAHLTNHRTGGLRIVVLWLIGNR